MLFMISQQCPALERTARSTQESDKKDKKLGKLLRNYCRISTS